MPLGGEDMKCEPCAFVAGLVTGLLASFLVFGALTRHFNPMDDEAQAAAVKAGKAEYYLDIDNRRQWRWKP